MNPNDASFYYWRAYTLSHLARHEEALHDIDQAILLSPDDPSLQEARDELAAKEKTLVVRINADGSMEQINADGSTEPVKPIEPVIGEGNIFSVTMSREDLLAALVGSNNDEKGIKILELEEGAILFPNDRDDVIFTWDDSDFDGAYELRVYETSHDPGSESWNNWQSYDKPFGSPQAVGYPGEFMTPGAKYELRIGKGDRWASASFYYQFIGEAMESESVETVEEASINETWTEDGLWKYVAVDDSNALITRVGVQAIQPNGILTIPNEVDGYAVRGIGYAVLPVFNEITSITIPASVISIQDEAFSYYSDVTLNVTSGSFAEQYAKENNFAYALLDVPAQVPESTKSSSHLSSTLGTIKITSGANIRSNSGTGNNAKVIGKVAQGETFDVLSQDAATGWYQFVWKDGQEVWISSKMVEFTPSGN